MKKFRIKCKPRGRASECHLILVDNEDAYLLRAHVWRVHRSDRGHIAVSRRTNDGGSTQLTHEILKVPAGTRVYHKNGDGRDCRRENLTLEHTRIGVRMRRFYALAGCYHPHYSELRP